MRNKVAKMIRRAVFENQSIRDPQYRDTSRVVETPWGHKIKQKGCIMLTGLKREYRIAKKVYKEMRRRGEPVWKSMPQKAALFILLFVGIAGAYQADPPQKTINRPEVIKMAEPEPQAVTTVAFYGDKGEKIGELSWATGEFVFTGKAKKSARVFFDRFLKHFVDDHLKSERAKMKKISK